MSWDGAVADLFACGGAAVEAGRVADVAAAGTDLLDLEDDGVLVAVGQDLVDFLHVTAGFALVPDFLTAAAVVDGLATLQGEFQRFLVHVGHHQDFTRFGIGGDGGNQAVGIEFRREI